MIEVESGLLAHPVDGVTVLLHVRAPEEQARLEPALRTAAADIAALDGGWDSAFGLSPGDRNGPKHVSAPIALPDGYLLMVDFGSTPVPLVRTVPQLLTRRLTEAGVRDATIGTPPRMGARHAAVTRLAPVARAWLRGPLGHPLGAAPRRPPDRLLAVAARWLTEHHPAGSEPIGLVISAELALNWPTVAAALRPTVESQTPVAAVASDFATAATAFAVEGGLLDAAPAASLSCAGARDLYADLVGLRDLVRAQAPTLMWGGVSTAPDAQDAYLAGWPGAGPGDPTDLIVPDGLWYQVLSEGHLDQLGGPPPGSRRLADGRVELTVGTPEQWLPGHPDHDAARAQARHLLAGCLPDEAELLALRRKRLQAARARDHEGLFPGPSR